MMTEKNVDGPLISSGFDRGMDFKTIKEKLIKDYERMIKIITSMDINKSNYNKRLTINMNRLIYSLIAMIQLRNGSRIREACHALAAFLDNDNIEDRVVVKLAKSKAIKYKKETHEMYETKQRYREMIFPSKWIKLPLHLHIQYFLEKIDKKRLMKRVLDYLLINFNCNTHSLRYSFINYMLYEKKKEMTIIAKFVGHSNVSQLVRYTQLKESNKLFDLDI